MIKETPNSPTEEQNFPKRNSYLLKLWVKRILTLGIIMLFQYVKKQRILSKLNDKVHAALLPNNNALTPEKVKASIKTIFSTECYQDMETGVKLSLLDILAEHSAVSEIRSEDLQMFFDCALHVSEDTVANELRTATANNPIQMNDFFNATESSEQQGPQTTIRLMYTTDLNKSLLQSYLAKRDDDDQDKWELLVAPGLWRKVSKEPSSHMYTESGSANVSSTASSLTSVDDNFRDNSSNLLSPSHSPGGNSLSNRDDNAAIGDGDSGSPTPDSRRSSISSNDGSLSESVNTKPNHLGISVTTNDELDELTDQKITSLNNGDSRDETPPARPSTSPTVQAQAQNGNAATREDTQSLSPSSQSNPAPTNDEEEIFASYAILKDVLANFNSEQKQKICRQWVVLKAQEGLGDSIESWPRRLGIIGKAPAIYKTQKEITEQFSLLATAEIKKWNKFFASNQDYQSFIAPVYFDTTNGQFMKVVADGSAKEVTDAEIEKLAKYLNISKVLEQETPLQKQDLMLKDFNPRVQMPAALDVESSTTQAAVIKNVDVSPKASLTVKSPTPIVTPSPAQPSIVSRGNESLDNVELNSDKNATPNADDTPLSTSPTSASPPTAQPSSQGGTPSLDGDDNGSKEESFSPDNSEALNGHQEVISEPITSERIAALLSYKEESMMAKIAAITANTPALTQVETKKLKKLQEKLNSGKQSLDSEEVFLDSDHELIKELEQKCRHWNIVRAQENFIRSLGGIWPTNGTGLYVVYATQKQITKATLLGTSEIVKWNKMIDKLKTTLTNNQNVSKEQCNQLLKPMLGPVWVDQEKGNLMRIIDIENNYDSQTITEEDVEKLAACMGLAAYIGVNPCVELEEKEVAKTTIANKMPSSDNPKERIEQFLKNIQERKHALAGANATQEFRTQDPHEASAITNGH